MEYNNLINYRNLQNHFARKAGVKTIDISEGYAECELRVEGDHFNVINTVSGGAIFTLMDAVGGAVATSYGNRVTTLSSSVNFLHAIKEPITLYAVGRTVKHGRQITVVDVRVEDYNGYTFSQGTFTYFNLGQPVDLK